MAEVGKLFRIRKTVNQMLKDRGYNVSKTESEKTLENFTQQFSENPSRENLTILARMEGNPTEQIFVFFPDEEKLGVGTIRKYHDRMRDEGVARAIIVLRGAITAFAKTALQELSNKYIMETFEEKELMVNITEHILVPKHLLLNPEEKEALLKRYNLKQDQLPRIQFSDPVARYYGLQRGQVVKIVRPSETAGRYVTYRLVI
eukprot:TRINITY_DN15552_c0_g1::TRINITY_DN15552_c0_g1_i1::g.28501::m.28501 TRINITY_DN15552_c0_g1::TRINITY_DN15552_c0_g1_i1::g.28501  ORF type:complete len:216 (+),score=37.46,sp/O81098/RPB5A_ARATH/51.50/1e-73,RNA_pol_Rpb5_C/PF01191.14/2.9e-35,RNA_pol_Rpb5_N/PF03871.9/4.2e-26,Pyr_excise/PF03013.9/0.5,Pyr_excise/PF03013.9/1.3e+02,Metal_hydrol/PF10118.4/3.8,Metal_hydrol/PF10118.4/20 TRINITY_DN15552_c0_g1_i1:42-650(+)